MQTTPTMEQTARRATGTPADTDAAASTPSDSDATTYRLDAEAFAAFQDEVRARQNLQMGFLGGLAGALFGAALWCAITVATGYQIGWMAVGVGALAGLGVRALGRGIDPMFGWFGGGLAVLGCLIGNLMAVCWVVAQQVEDLTFFGLLTSLDLGAIVELLKLTFSPMDVLFYALAVAAGYRLAFRQVRPEEAERFVRPT